jgi:hypothetical protein
MVDVAQTRFPLHNPTEWSHMEWVRESEHHYLFTRRNISSFSLEWSQIPECHATKPLDWMNWICKWRVDELASSLSPSHYMQLHSVGLCRGKSVHATSITGCWWIEFENYGSYRDNWQERVRNSMERVGLQTGHLSGHENLWVKWQ